MDGKPAIAPEMEPVPAAEQKYFVWTALLMTIVTYIGTVRFNFTYDDSPQIVFNPFLTAWRYVPQFFVSSVWKHMSPTIPGNYYRPLFLVLLRICYFVFGMRPSGWHLVALALHVMATWLTYLVIRKMTGEFVVSWLAALIFGLHPIHHEVVAWVSATDESLFAVLFLLAFLAYLKSREQSRIFWMSVSCAFYVLSLWSKETAIVLPLLVFVHAWIENVGGDGSSSVASRFRSALLPAAAFLPVALVYLIVRNRILVGFGHPYVEIPVTNWLLTIPSILLFYVKNWLLPYRMSESYDLFYQSNLNLAHVVLPSLVLVAVTVAVWVARKRFGVKSVAMAGAWMLIPLLPALDTFVFRPDELVHDRYFYLPSVGAAMLIALIVDRAIKSRRGLFGLPSHVLATGMVFAVVLSFLSARAVSYWSDDLPLFTRAHQVAPLNVTAMNNLGVILLSHREFDAAQALFETGHRNNPDDFRFTFNLGRLYNKKGEYPKAEAYMRNAIELSSSSAEAYAYLAEIELRQNRAAEAQKDLRHAVELNPYWAPFHTSYGIVLALSGDCSSANEQFQVALTLNSEDPISQMQMIRCRIALSHASPSKPGQL